MRSTSTIRILASLALAFSFCAGTSTAQLPNYNAGYVRAYGSTPVLTEYVGMQDENTLSFVLPGGNATFDWNGTIFTGTFDTVNTFDLRDSSITARVGITMHDGAGSTGLMQLNIDGLIGEAATDAAEFYWVTAADRWEANYPILATGFDLGTASWTASGDSILLELESANAATFDADGFSFVPPVTMDGVTIGEAGDGYRIDFAVTGEAAGFLSITAVDAEPFVFTNSALFEGTAAANAVSIGDAGIIWNNDANTRIVPNASEGLDIPGTLNVDNLLRISGNTGSDGLSIDGSIVLTGSRALQNVTSGSFGTNISTTAGELTTTLTSNALTGPTFVNASNESGAAVSLEMTNDAGNVSVLQLRSTGFATGAGDVFLSAPSSEQLVLRSGSSNGLTVNSSANLLAENALTVNSAAGASGTLRSTRRRAGHRFSSTFRRTRWRRGAL